MLTQVLDWIDYLAFARNYLNVTIRSVEAWAVGFPVQGQLTPD